MKNKDSWEIVGIIVKGTVYTGFSAFQAVKHNKSFDALISREKARFMSNLDFGKNWDDLSRCPTLFLLDENNNPSWPTDEYAIQSEFDCMVPFPLALLAVLSDGK